MVYEDLLRAELNGLGLRLPNETVGKLARYCTELERWNARMNLTSLSGRALVQRLVVDPVWIAFSLNMAGTVIDIGSGNGSPAIPLIIAREFDSMHMVESRVRRAAFLRHVKAALALERATVHRGRFEDVAEEIGGCDWITVQGVALTEDLLGSIRKIQAPQTKIVWITWKEAQPPKGFAFNRLRTALTDSSVFVLALDHS